MGKTDKDDELILDNTQKWILSLIAGLLFMIISFPAVYQFMDKCTKSSVKLSVAASNGCPNEYGLLFHGIVYILLFRLIIM